MTVTAILNIILLVCSLHNTAQIPAPCDSTDKALLEYYRSRNIEGVVYYTAGEYRLAVECFMELADNNYPPALTNLGIAYLNGTGIKQDSHKAFDCFHSAATKGESAAQMHLGTMYARGIGTAMNDSAAIYWFSKVAEQGDTKAMNSIGIIYLNGNDIEADSTEACRWFRESAIRGDDDGLFYLGLSLTRMASEYTDSVLGNGRNCIYNAARNGHKAAQKYLMNDAIDHNNYFLVYRWSKILHESGEIDGTMALAYCYRYGLGVERSKRKAKKLYTEAATAGNEEAARILEEW